MTLLRPRNSMIFGPDYSVSDYFATGAGAIDDRFAFVAAATASSYIVVPPGTYRISSDLTLSGTIEFKPGAILKPDFGVTVTLSGEIVAGAWRIFDISLGGAIAGGARNAMILPDWWGAAPGVASSQTAAAQAAITFAEVTGATAFFRAGSWRFDTGLTVSAPCAVSGAAGVRGASTDRATVFSFAAASAGITGLTVSGDGIVVENIAFTANSAHAKGSGDRAIFAHSTYRLVLRALTTWWWDVGIVLGSVSTDPAAPINTLGLLHDVRLLESKTTGLHVWTAIDFQFEHCSIGIAVNGDQNVLINAAGGVFFSRVNALHFVGCLFIGDIGTRTVGNLVRIEDGFWLNFDKCVFEQSGGCGVLLYYSQAQDQSIINCKIRDCHMDEVVTGVSCTLQTANYRVHDSRMMGKFVAAFLHSPSIGASPESDVIFSGNNVVCTVAAASAGIVIDNAAGVTVSNNRVRMAAAANPNPGVVLNSATALRSIVTGNRITTSSGLTATGVIDNGTSSVLRDNFKL